MKNLIIRNLKLYFRDRLSIMFSMMSIFIMLGLYVFFLADIIMSGALETLENGKYILNLWLLAGMLAMASVTTTFASYGIMVQDRSKGIVKDLYASSVPRYKLLLSYICASWIIGVLMSFVTIVIGELFIAGTGGDLIGLESLGKAMGVMLLSVAAGSSMMFFLASFLYTESSFSNASILLGTLIGFLMGIYIPIGTLPAFAQQVIKFFPMSQGCAALRQILVQEPLQAALIDAPTFVLSEIENALGITFTYGATTLTFMQHILLLVCTLIGFYALSILCVKFKKAK